MPTADAVINRQPENLLPLMGAINPNVPIMNTESMVGIIDVNTIADYPKGDYRSSSTRDDRNYADRWFRTILDEHRRLSFFAQPFKRRNSGTAYGLQ